MTHPRIDRCPRFSDIRYWIIRKGAYRHVDAFCRAGSGGGELAVGVRHSLEADGGDGEGEGDLTAEDSRRSGGL